MFTIKGSDMRLANHLLYNDIQVGRCRKIFWSLIIQDNLYAKPYQIYMIDIDFNAGTCYQ